MEPQVFELEKMFPFQVTEVLKDGKVVHSVDGIATSDSVDKDDERADYTGTLAELKSWSDDAVAKTSSNGQEVSLGNIRLQHDSKIIAGKVTALEPRDAKKQVFIKTQPRNAIYDEYIHPGMVTGFSIAGSYKSRVCDECGKDKPGRAKYCTPCKKNTVSRYVPTISEISYVDNACNPDAEFLTVKLDGSQVLRKFSDLRRAASACSCTCQNCKDSKCAECNNPTCESKNCAGCKMAEQKATTPAGIVKLVEDVLVEHGVIKEKKTKRVGGKDLPASSFAYVGDADDTSTWKLPIHDAAHCRAALARFNQTQGIPAGEKAKVKAKVVAAAKKFGIKVSEDSKKCVDFAFAKLLNEAGHDGLAIMAKANEIFERVDGETKLFKGLYTVSSLAEILQNLQWIVASTEYERDYEGDDSQVPDDLRSVLEDLIPVFVAMASEEAHELLSQNQKTAKSGQGGNMSEPNADLLKAAKDLAADIWKKAKSLFHKIAKSHDGCAKAFHKAAEHHEDMAEHYSKCAEAGMDKAIQTELEKLNTAEFAKTPKIDQLLAKADVLEKAKGMAGCFGKMSKCHGNMAKCMTKAAEGHEAMDKAAVAVGSAEDSIAMGDSEHDNKGAEPGGSSEKALIAELEKKLDDLTKAGQNSDLVKAVGDLIKPLTEQMTAISTKVDGVKKDVDEKLGKTLDPGPVDAAKNRLRPALDDKHAVDEHGKPVKKSEDGSGSRMFRKGSGSAESVASTSVFA